MKMYVFDTDDLRKLGLDITDDGVKCGGCNWRTSRLYVLADSREEAEKELRNGEAGLCASCIADLLIDFMNQGYELVPSEGHD